MTKTTKVTIELPATVTFKHQDHELTMVTSDIHATAWAGLALYGMRKVNDAGNSLAFNAKKKGTDYDPEAFLSDVEVTLKEGGLSFAGAGDADVWREFRQALVNKRIGGLPIIGKVSDVKSMEEAQKRITERVAVLFAKQMGEGTVDEVKSALTEPKVLDKSEQVFEEVWSMAERAVNERKVDVEVNWDD